MTDKTENGCKRSSSLKSLWEGLGYLLLFIGLGVGFHTCYSDCAATCGTGNVQSDIGGFCTCFEKEAQP